MSQRDATAYPSTVGWAMVLGVFILLLVAEGWLFFVAT